ncbi:MAG TPA: hypothetical protein VN818_03410 [Gammaproteobacteria bacterium]|nr:hypothetical protein [Gammaproteobacteria bacterium]
MSPEATGLLIYVLGGGAGAAITARALDTKLNPLLAFVAVALATLCLLIPYGRYVAFLVSVVLFRQMSPKGDWQDAFFTAIGGSALVFVAFFFYGVKSISEA